MKIVSHAILCAFYCCVLFAQHPIQPPTQEQINFFRYLLMSIGSSDHDPKISKMNRDGIVLLYGLNEQEAKVLDSAGKSFASAMISFQRSKTAITSGKATLTDADRASIAVLSSQLDETIKNLANQILTSVRLERAVLLRLQGDLRERVTTNAGTVQ